MAKKIFSQEPGAYVVSLAEALKKVPEFEIPEWTFFIKSGSSRERPPVQEDFWYLRAASILRQLYIKGVVGVNKLRTRYGSRKDRGGKPDKFRKGSGKIIRVILQQAEKAGFVEKLDRLQYGRRLTEAGRDFLDSIEVEKIKDFDLDGVLVKTSVDEFEQEVSVMGNVPEGVEGSKDEDVEAEKVGKAEKKVKAKEKKKETDVEEKDDEEDEDVEVEAEVVVKKEEAEVEDDEKDDDDEKIDEEEKENGK